jgi:hypothetical protein
MVRRLSYSMHLQVVVQAEAPMVGDGSGARPDADE